MIKKIQHYAIKSFIATAIASLFFYNVFHLQENISTFFFCISLCFLWWYLNNFYLLFCDLKEEEKKYNELNEIKKE